MNFRYPIFLDVAGKKCLVVGEGFELPAKIQTLVSRGADLTYVNPTADLTIASLAEQNRIVWHRRAFEPADLNGCFLVITDQDENAQVFHLAEERNVLCNAADDPEFCRFSFGSVVTRGNLTVAISTNGVAPAVAVRLREKLEREIGEEYERFLALLEQLRPEITRSIPDFETRRRLWYQLVDSDALSLLRTGQTDEAHLLIRRIVEEARASVPSGSVPVIE